MGPVIESAVVQGCLYALVGVGFVVLFRATGVLNFAQGAFMVLGGFLFSTLHSRFDLNLYLALVATILAMGVIGAAVYMGAFRRLVGAAPFTLVIATLGLAIVLQTATVLIWGPGLRTLPLLLSIRPAVHIVGVSFSALELFCIVVSLVLIGSLQLLLRRTRLGTRMRAVADNTLLAGLTGVRVHGMSALAWGIAASCAGVAGVCIALRTALDPIQLQGFGLVAFAAVLLGGMDSILGALVGGLVLGLVQALAVHRFGGTWSDAVAYMVLLAMLLVRPQGVFGRPETLRL